MIGLLLCLDEGFNGAVIELAARVFLFSCLVSRSQCKVVVLRRPWSGNKSFLRPLLLLVCFLIAINVQIPAVSLVLFPCHIDQLISLSHKRATFIS
jgi:hypothetical protein